MDGIAQPHVKMISGNKRIYRALEHILLQGMNVFVSKRDLQIAYILEKIFWEGRRVE
jgi:hypothetical protein